MSKYDYIILIAGVVITMSLCYNLSKNNRIKLLLVTLSIFSLHFIFSGNAYLDKRIFAMISSLNSERLEYLNNNTKSAYYKEILTGINSSFINDPNTSFSMMVEIDRALSKQGMLTSRVLNYSMYF